MIKIQISSDGLEDLKEGFLFYEAQEVGLGEYFSHSLKSDIEGLGKIIRQIVRGAGLQRFSVLHHSFDAEGP